MGRKILVETSARHVHVSQTDLETLFGEGYTLTNKKDLSQPGQFACEEKVTVIGPKGETKMSILGPTRASTQVEVSLTDARSLGIKALVRESGDIDGTQGCKLVGPAGEVEIPCGVIAAKRHIHMTPADAQEFGSQLTFWGGGIDTQQILPFGTPDEIRRHVIGQCEILGRDGGFIFNAVHNIQANVPIENVVALFDTLKSLRN